MPEEHKLFRIGSDQNVPESDLQTLAEMLCPVIADWQGSHTVLQNKTFTIYLTGPDAVQRPIMECPRDIDIIPDSTPRAAVIPAPPPGPPEGESGTATADDEETE